MPSTQSNISQTNPQGDFTWESVPNPQRSDAWNSPLNGLPWGPDQMANVASTVTVAPASRVSAQEGTASVTDKRTCANAIAAPLQEDTFAAARAKLDQIQSEGAGDVVVQHAKYIFEEIVRASLVPARVVLSADRQIAFVFFDEELLAGGAHRRIATLTCSQDGPSILLEDRQRNERQAWDVEIEQVRHALGRIRSFVAGQ